MKPLPPFQVIYQTAEDGLGDTVKPRLIEAEADLDRDAATVLMVESNYQRSQILPSEKAFAYKMRLEAKFKVSDKPLDGYRYLGRLVASMKNYEV